MDSAIIKKANELFEKINKVMSEKNKGKIIAIDGESGDYYIGESELDAYNQAIKKHPKKQFLFKRIGFRSTHFVGQENERIFCFWNSCNCVNAKTKEDRDNC